MADARLTVGGGWICYRGYDANTNTIGYQLRTNSGNRPMSDAAYRYRLYFTSADGSKWVPANTSTSTNATTARTLNTRPIDPFGPIVYNSTNDTTDSGARPAVATLWQQYTLTIGYSYVKSLTAWDSVWLKCQPQSDGSAVMKDIVQALPSSKDGYIYILLGMAYSATAMELRTEHPVYWHDGTGIRLWTGAEYVTDAGVTSFNGSTGAVTYTAPVTSVNGSTGAITGLATTAQLDAKQATLVSGVNIKTVNGNSLLGSGDLVISGGSGVTYTTATATIPTSGWGNGSITVNVSAVTATSDVIVAPAPASMAAWAAAGIVCTAQGAGTLTFTCSTAPTEAITANVMSFEGGTAVHSITAVSAHVYDAYPNGDEITVAVEGQTVYIGVEPKTEAMAVRDDTMASIALTEVSASSQGDYYSFVMPGASVTVTGGL